MIKVFLVEDDADAAYFIEEILTNSKNILYLGHAKNGLEGIRKIEQLKPDVVLMDIGLPDIDGIECVKRLKPMLPKTQFVMCTAIDTDENVFNAIYYGASSFVLKNSDAEELIEVIEGVFDGQSPINADIARKMITFLQNSRKPNPNLNVTKKEHQILELLSKGHTYMEIADLLLITVKTLKGHIYRIYAKLQVDNRTEAINKYYGKIKPSQF